MCTVPAPPRRGAGHAVSGTVFQDQRHGASGRENGSQVVSKPLSEAAKRAIQRQAPDGVRRAARAEACPSCGQTTMRGLDGDVAAFAVRVDVRPLSQAGELAALVAGRRTYALRWIAGRARYEIDTRDPINIEHEPAGSKMNLDVVVTHSCGAAPLPIMRTTHVRRTHRENSIDPPF